MCDLSVAEGVSRFTITGGRWLGTGVNGGFGPADAAVNLTVPAAFDRTDLGTYVTERCPDASGPALLTAVDQANARAARAGPVTVLATAGLSNPARLPVPGASTGDDGGADPHGERIGTVNLVVGTDRALGDPAMASLLATAVEAKTATLQARTGFTGTTSDAAAVGCDPAGNDISFVGSNTDVGSAVRACVRDSVLASLDTTYADGDVPRSVAAAEHGTVTERETTVYAP